MIIDNFQLFTGTSNGATGGITASANTDSPTTGTQVASNIIDYGIVSGIPASASGGGARDMGVGEGPVLKFAAIVTTAFTGGTSLQLEMSIAPDNGSGSPGSYSVIWTSPAIAEANLYQGARLSNIDLPRVIPGASTPGRFYRLRFISVGSHSAGAIECFVVINEFEQVLGSGGAISGYPAGINVAN